MNEPFSAWIQGVWYYGPVLGAGILLVILGLGMLLFFRDFPREITAAPNEVVSPADGTVVAIEDLEETPHYEGKTRRISIFMSVFNAHVNRAPYEGTVRELKYAPGQYKNAMRPDSTRLNESNAVWMDTPRGPMTVRQISGAIARRIVCPVQAGTKLDKGEKFGMIRFGSRVELYLPPDTEVCVTLKEKVYAGSSVVARFP